MLMTFNLIGKSNATTFFVVAYGPTDTVSSMQEWKDAFWADLDCVVSRVPSSNVLFVFIYVNARTCV